MAKDLLDKLKSAQGDGKQVAALKARVKQLDALVEQQARQIEEVRKAKYTIPKARKITSSNADFCRIIIPDTHGSVADKQALAAFLRDLKGLSGAVKEIVMIGDHLECGGFLARHHALGYVAQTEYSFEDDVDAANKLLDEIQAICPTAAIHYLEGNHERRIESWITDQVASGSTQDGKYLRKMFSTESVLHLDDRKINYYKQGVFYQGLRIPATIKLGPCHFTHGIRCGKDAARKTLDDFAANVWFGHTHTADMATKRTVSGGMITAANPGCLSLQQPLWRHTQVTSWTHGFGLQLVRRDLDFLNIIAPIIDGKSYLMQLTERIGA
jgi:predicted phosphodiesterase